MPYFLLDDYHLTNGEVLRSTFLSEYALRHFQKAKESMNRGEKLVHRLIGLVEIIPLLGGLASAIERAYAAAAIHDKKNGQYFVKKGGVSADSAGAIPQIKTIRQNDSRKMTDTPFCSKLHLYHGCLNEGALPIFKVHAQAAFRITKKFLNAGRQTDPINANLRVFFLFQGVPFQIYCAPFDQECHDIFVQNLPKDEQIAIQIQLLQKNQEPVEIEQIAFQPIYTRGEYLFTTTGNSKTLKALPMPEPIGIYPGFHLKGPSAFSVVRDVQLPLDLKIKEKGRFEVDTRYQPRSSSEHLLIENSSKFPVLLTFDLVPVLDHYQTEEAISHAIIIFPGDKRKFNRKYLQEAWTCAYKIAIDKAAFPEPPLLDILYIQVDSFGNPYS